MSLASYLVQRGARGIWHLRVPIPRALHGPGKPRERVRSMRTTDRRIASDRALAVLDSWKREWAASLEASSRASAEPDLAHGAPPAGSFPPPLSALLLNLSEKFFQALEERRRGKPRDSQSRDAWAQKCQQDLQLLAERHADGDDAVFRQMVDDQIQKHALPIVAGTPEYEQMVTDFAEVAIDTLLRYRRRLTGELHIEPAHPLVREEMARRANTAKPGERLLELYDAYRDWRCAPGRKKRRRLQTFEHDRPAVELFAEFVGVDRAAASITKADARNFRTMLAKFPASRAKNPRLAKRSISDCIAIAEREGLPLLSLTTQAKYLSILSPFFGWLVSDAPKPIESNPFVGLHIKVEKGENRRPSYTARDLQKIVDAPLFSRCAGDGGEHIAGDVAVRDWRYWIPLLCLFTGSRITEIAQLGVDDVSERDGVPLIVIDHDEARGLFVKSKRRRIAALHPVLIEAGFLAYCATQRRRATRDGNKQLFPELKAGPRGLLGDYPSKWFRRLLVRLGVKGSNDGVGAHSFRHTLTDAMRAAGYMDVEFGQLILGHANNSITDQYGSVRQGTPARLRTMLDAAFRAEPFASVRFAHLIAP